MATPLERAFVEIVADTSAFSEDLEDNVRQTLRVTLQRVQKMLNELEGDFKDTARTISRSLGGSLSQVGREGRNDIDILRKAFIRLKEELSVAGKEGREVFKALETELLNFAQSVRTVEQRVKGSMGAIVTEIEDVERAFKKNLGRTLFQVLNNGFESTEAAVKSFGDQAEASARAISREFRDLANQPGLEAVRDSVENLAEVLDDQLRDAIRLASRELAGLDDALTEDELANELIRIADIVDNQLTASLRRAKFNLGLLADGAPVDELVADMRRLAVETQRTAEEAARAARRYDLFGRELDAKGRVIRGASRNLSNFESGLQRFRFGLLDARFVVAAFGGIAIERLSEFGIKGAAALQTVRTGLDVFIEDVQRARGITSGFGEITDRVVEDIRRTAAVTPFSFESLAESTRRLAAFSDATGRAGEDIESTFRIARQDITDLSGLLSVLGQGDEALIPLIKAIGDVGARGRITGEEVRQFTNALPGFSVLDEIANQLTKSDSKFKDLADTLGLTGLEGAALTSRFLEVNSAGLIPARVSVEALIDAAKEFPGAAEALGAQAQTLAGRFETLKDELTFSLSDGFLPLTQFLADNVLGVIKDLDEPLQAFARGISAIATTALPRLIPLLAQLAENIGNTFASNEFEEVLESLFQFLEALIPAIDAVIETLLDLTPVFQTLVDVLSSLLTGFTALPGPLKDLAAALTTATFFGRGFIKSLDPKEVKSFIGGLRQLPSSVGKVAKGLKAFVDVSGGVGPALKLVATSAVSATAALGALGAVLLIGFEGAKSYRRGVDEVVEANDELIANIGRQFDTSTNAGNIEALGKQVQVLGAQFQSAAQDIPSDFNIAANLGQSLPLLSTEGERARQSVEGLGLSLEELQIVQNDVGRNINVIKRSFQDLVPGLKLSKDEILQIADELDIDFDVLSLDTTEFKAQIADIIEAGGGGIDVLRRLGLVSAEAAGALKPYTDAQRDLKLAIDGAISSLNAQLDQQRALTDPVFAAQQAFQALEEAEKSFAEATGDEVEGAAFALVGAQETFDDAVAALAASGSDFESAIESVERQFEGTRAAEAVKTVTDALGEVAGEASQRIGELGETFGTDFGELLPSVIKTGADDTITAFEEFKTQFGTELEALGPLTEAQALEIGRLLAQGFADGIDEAEFRARAAARGMTQRALQEMRNLAEIASPSRAAREIGEFIGEGFADGLLRLQDRVANQGRALADAAIGGIRSGSGRGFGVGADLNVNAAGANVAASVGAGANVSGGVSRQTVVEAPITINTSGSGQAAASAVQDRLLQFVR